MSVRIQIRRGTSSEWETANPVLASGELGYDSTNDRLKVGDGSSNWNSLPDADDQIASQVEYLNSTSGLVATNVQGAIDEIEGRVDTNESDITSVEGRLDTIEGDASTEGSVAKAEADAKAYTDARESAITTAYESYADQAEADAKSYADTEIAAAKLALGTNYSVADIVARNALEDLTVGDVVFVSDDGDGKWAQYKVSEIDPYVFLKIMDQDIFLNALSAPDVKAAYESNADTNAFTDSLLNKLNGIEANAKDDQDASEVSYIDTNETYAVGNNVQAAIYAIDDELIAQDGRLDTIEGDDQTEGSIAKALKDAKDYADAQDALQDEASEITYSNSTSGLSASTVQAAIDEVEGRVDVNESDITSVEGRLDTIEGDNQTEGSIAKAESDAKAYTDAREIAITTAYESYADQAESDAKAYTDTRENAITTAYESYADQAESDAKAYTDTRENAITTAYESYADQAEADAITTANNYTDAREIAITTAYESYADQAESDAKTYADAEIAAAKLALGTNYSVADRDAAEALPDLNIGDIVFITDDGDGNWAQYIVRDVLPEEYDFLKIMDQDSLLNSIDASSVKFTYESNADTNAFTDELLSKLNSIEENAKDDQNAAEVSYDNSASSLESTNVQGAIDEIKSSHIDHSEIHFTQGEISITESQISDFGNYEPADSSILKSTDIGVSVQGYNADTVVDDLYERFDSSATYENLRAQATTAEDVGLGNVTNESKATMFTNSAFTGVPVAPTAATLTNTTQIATTEFVQQELATIDGGEFI